MTVGTLVVSVNPANAQLTCLCLLYLYRDSTHTLHILLPSTDTLSPAGSSVDAENILISGVVLL